MTHAIMYIALYQLYYLKTKVIPHNLYERYSIPDHIINVQTIDLANANYK